MKIKAVHEDLSIYRSMPTTDTASSTQPNAEIHLPSPTQLYLLDIPILHDEDDDTGFYTAVSHLLPHWFGAVIAESKDNGQTFKALYSQNHAATVGKKPFSPVHLQSTRNEIGDLMLTWISRTRIQGTWRDSVDAPHDPEISGYEVHIVKEQEIVRTITNTTEMVTYTAEQQLADFGSLPTLITIKLYAIGKTVGRGFPVTATL